LKILLSANTSWYLRNFRAGLIEFLVNEGHNLVVLAPDDAASRYLEEIGCTLLPVKIERKGVNPIIDLGFVIQVISALRRVRPDVAFVFTIKPLIYVSIAAKILRIPVIATVTGLGTVFIRRSWVTFVVRLLYKFALWKVQKIFFQNQSDLDLFLEHGLVDSAITDLCPGSGVDLTHFVFSNPPLRSSDELIFLFVGRLLRDKGLAEFVEAAIKFRQNRPRTRFQVLGDIDPGNSSSFTEQEIETFSANGVVDFLGSTNDVRSFIHNADCIVLPSYREGTSRVLIETAAMGRPAITTDVPGCRDVVLHGVTGLICVARSHEALLLSLDQFASLPKDARKGLGLAARTRAEDLFDQKGVISRYNQALGQVEHQPSLTSGGN